jgi:hypothetical protein
MRERLKQSGKMDKLDSPRLAPGVDNLRFEFAT